MSASRSLIYQKHILNTVRANHGIRQAELTKHGLKQRTAWKHVLNLCLLGKLVRVRDERSFRLFLPGTEPKHVHVERHWRGVWLENSPINKLHGEAFRFAFDEGYGLLYCDLMIIARGCYG